MVGEQVKSLEWPESVTALPILCDRDRRLQIGWGAFLQGEATGGCWGPEEQRLHINKLELLAVSYALKSFLKREENIEVLIKSDNIAVVSYINKLGGTKSPRLIALTKQIFAWCLHRQIRVSAQQLPGKENLTVDFCPGT